MDAWIALAAIAVVVVLGALVARWATWRRERRADYRGEHRIRRRGGGPR